MAATSQGSDARDFLSVGSGSVSVPSAGGVRSACQPLLITHLTNLSVWWRLTGQFVTNQLQLKLDSSGQGRTQVSQVGSDLSWQTDRWWISDQLMAASLASESCQRDQTESWSSRQLPARQSTCDCHHTASFLLLVSLTQHATPYGVATMILTMILTMIATMIRWYRTELYVTLKRIFLRVLP